MMLYRSLTRAAIVFLAAVVLPLAPPAHAQAPVESLSLDADYTGSTYLHALYQATLWNFGASGQNLAAASGLTTVGFGLEGGFDYFGDRATFAQTDPALLALTAPNGDHLLGAIWPSGGTIYDYTGSFVLTEGTGLYAGYQGSGTFHVAAGPYDSGLTGAPATLAVRGTATRPSAVPEPASLSLLASFLLPLTLFRRSAKTASRP